MKYPTPTAHTTIATPLGNLLLAATAQGLAGAWFTQGQRDFPDRSTWRPERDSPLLRQARDELAAYFAGQRLRFDVPLDLSTGTAFQQDVWHALLNIDVGTALSYSDLAAHIGRPAAVRAVGTAVGANPLIVIVPCHRVIGRDGTLTGFGGGLRRKVALLRLEGWQIAGDAPGLDNAALRRLHAAPVGARHDAGLFADSAG
ncbi:methylated-DNA--[protein]-cysteine S-methyltransferase [Ottowia sp.]|uniref:methylated-DNA--[protein]-cysteine S-methyltransferase n=1 Tax=Ottowia sp. TaxID=1898956 RepID=UPI003A86589A